MSLFKKAIASEDGEERRDLLDEITRMLRVHTHIEEEIFYPAFREVVGTKKGEEQVLEAYEEHHVVDLVLAELPDIDLESETYKAKITVLKELVEHHVEEEQEEMFPAAEKKLGKERLDELAREMQAAAEEQQQALEAEGAAMH
ncbi:MAG: hemerythrin [Proteobacteria bacterium]|nr:MAG: hemerythrin [Pseudomonadota bacterium]